MIIIWYYINIIQRLRKKKIRNNSTFPLIPGKVSKFAILLLLLYPHKKSSSFISSQSVSPDWLPGDKTTIFALHNHLYQTGVSNTTASPGQNFRLHS